MFRLASRPNSDNTTERLAHIRMSARTVQVFGELSTLNRSRGWQSVEDLYRLHKVKFDPTDVLQKVATRYQATY